MMSEAQAAKVDAVRGRWCSGHAQLAGIALATDRIAHDFNNLLSVIISNLDLLERKTDAAEPSYRWVDRSLRAALKCAEYTEDLLSYARGHSFSSTSIIVNESVGACVDELRNGDSRILETSLHPDLWATRINSEDFRESLKALIKNAIEATNSSGKVFVTTDNAATNSEGRPPVSDVPPGEYIVVQVVDNGIGMGDEVLERAVDPFFSTKSSTHHSGMGLSRVFGFLRRSEGHLEIHSEVGCGTTVRMFLPRDSQDYLENHEGR